MAPPASVSALLACALAGLPAVAAHGMGQAPAPGPIATSTVPAQVCVTPTAADLQALQEDRQRVVIVLRAFEPPRPANGRLVASLLAGEPPTPREITRFAVHPLRAFTAAQPQRSQRFLVSLAGYAHLLQAGQPVCLQIGFPTDGHPHEGGRADVAIELFPVQ
ncbi:hypothetical protein [Acidovorax sp. NCPPB 3576]|uniref:hypothetical protein n=1 Tax=Acidovorax sp. NCPPB 3576 TaxID=2940488 RepID=UPI00234956F1|nr:hypothetical protein [Acidovorax sp. NCPPB 3576]WCM90282.1 hypothetical protein M5C98_09815 [Acidovorax sp. NCPPB 3576]